MKKILKYVMIIAIFKVIIVFVSNVYAATASITASKTSAYVGDSVTINVNINAAAWNLNVSGNGISGGNITGFNMEGSNQTTTKSYTLNTSSVGTYVISLKGDISDGATDVTSDISSSVSITVKERPVVTTPSQTTSPNTNANTTQAKPSTSVRPSNTNTNNTNVALSNNAFLSQFRVSEPGITPVFNKTIYSYAITVGEDVNNLDVLAIPEHSSATVSISGNNDLKVGDNIINVKVTAQDKKTINTYTITVTKSDNPEKSNAYLQSIFVENNTLNPEFSSEVLEYNLETIDEKTNKLNISAFPINENAKVEIIGNENLLIDKNAIKIVVTAEDGENQKTYILNVNKEGKEENKLINISNNGSNVKYTSVLEDIWNALKENGTILLLYSLVWIEFLQVVYLYERLKKAENVDVITKENVHEQAYIDKVKGMIKRIKIWKNNKEE